ncbi:MAG: hypothetical protein HRT36_09275, partial [Alphaproteobacteria bacterium]|nr:hypothetical protein [Alphaproteobacteria bacterium]
LLTLLVTPASLYLIERKRWDAEHKTPPSAADTPKADPEISDESETP